MNILCDKILLSTAIDGVSRAVAVRSSIPVMEGILLKADGFQLTLTGYNNEMAIITSIDADFRSAGETVLNAKLFSDMVRRMPSGQIEIEVPDSGKATIRGGVAEFEIQSMAASEFPNLPDTGISDTVTIKAETLRSMIDLTIYAVSTDDRKPAHTGELFEVNDGKLTIVALDGYRLAITERPIEASKPMRIIIPAKTMTEVSRLIPNDAEADVNISANRHFVVFSAGGYTIISRLIEGDFLNFRNVIPETHRTSAVIDAKLFAETIERDSLIITERLKNPLRITFTNHKATVRCQTNVGRVVDELSAETEGESIEIGFNNRYLLDALRYSRCDSVRIEICGQLNPVKIQPSEGDAFLYLVLPVRFKND